MKKGNPGNSHKTMMIMISIIVIVTALSFIGVYHVVSNKIVDNNMNVMTELTLHDRNAIGSERKN